SAKPGPDPSVLRLNHRFSTFEREGCPAMNDFKPDSKPLSVRNIPPLAAVRDKWGWFLALGALLVVIGFLAAAHVFLGTLGSVVVVGTLVLRAGVGLLVNAWPVQGWGSFALWTVSGVLEPGARLHAFCKPAGGAAVFPLLLGATLFGSGAFRQRVWVQNR